MQKAAECIFHPGEEYLLKNRKWQGCPSIEKAGKRLWATWFSGGKFEPSTENYGILAYSDDAGESWVEPYMILACNPSDRQRVFETQLWMDNHGRLWFFWGQDAYAKDAKPTDYDASDEELRNSFFCGLQQWAMYCDNPEAEEIVWSEPMYMGENRFLRNNPTVLKDGRWLIPAYTTKEGKYCQYMISEDSGKTMIPMEGPKRLGATAYDEPMAVELKNGDIWFLARTLTGYISESFSSDGGKTWTETKETAIPNPSTRFYIGRLKSGELLLVNTPSNVLGDRQSLVVSLSEDEGKTWKYNFKIDDRRSTTYPDVALDENGYIYIIYDCQRDNRQEPDKENPLKSNAAKEVCIAKITVEDIKAGRLVDKESYLQKIISKVTYNSRECEKLS